MNIASEYVLRDAVLNALLSTYAPLEVQGKDWYQVKNWVEKNNSFSVDLCLQLTTDILALFAFAHVDPENNHRAKYYGETMFNRVHQMIWNTFSGGTTAEGTAVKVGRVLNFTKED